jgi:hypothetical protein
MTDQFQTGIGAHQPLAQCILLASLQELKRSDLEAMANVEMIGVLLSLPCLQCCCMV